MCRRPRQEHPVQRELVGHEGGVQHALVAAESRYVGQPVGQALVHCGRGGPLTLDGQDELEPELVQSPEVTAWLRCPGVRSGGEDYSDACTPQCVAAPELQSSAKYSMYQHENK